MDDLIIIGDNRKFSMFKQFLQIFESFLLRWDRSILISTKDSSILTPRKYVFDMFTKCGLLGCKPMGSPMLTTGRLLPDDGNPMKDLDRYKRLVGKLNYVTTTGYHSSLVS